MKLFKNWSNYKVVFLNQLGASVNALRCSCCGTFSDADEYALDALFSITVANLPRKWYLDLFDLTQDPQNYNLPFLINAYFPCRL